MLLENVRFHNEETQNDETFSKELASMAQIYVNDAKEYSGFTSPFRLPRCDAKTIAQLLSNKYFIVGIADTILLQLL